MFDLPSGSYAKAPNLRLSPRILYGAIRVYPFFRDYREYLQGTPLTVSTGSGANPYFEETLDNKGRPIATLRHEQEDYYSSGFSFNSTWPGSNPFTIVCWHRNTSLPGTFGLQGRYLSGGHTFFGYNSQHYFGVANKTAQGGTRHTNWRTTVVVATGTNASYYTDGSYLLGVTSYAYTNGGTFSWGNHGGSSGFNTVNIGNVAFGAFYARQWTLDEILAFADDPTSYIWERPKLHFVRASVVSGSATIAVPVGAIVTEGAAPSVTTTAHKSVAPALGSAVIEGLNPAIEVSVANTVQPSVGTVHAEGKAPALIVSLTVQPAQGTIAVEGAAPLLRSDIIVPLGAAVVAGFEPLVSVGLPQLVRPVADIAADGWLPSSGSDLYAMLNEETPDDDNYIYSPTNPTTQTFEVKFASAVDPVLHSGHEIVVRLQAVNEDSTFDLYLVQGTDVLDSWTEEVGLLDEATTRTHVLSEAVAASITDYSDLRLRGTARAPSG